MRGSRDVPHIADGPFHHRFSPSCSVAPWIASIDNEAREGAVRIAHRVDRKRIYLARNAERAVAGGSSNLAAGAAAVAPGRGDLLPNINDALPFSLGLVLAPVAINRFNEVLLFEGRFWGK